MTPCEDIKTIHASQNDNEAREWEFELHNNGEVIDAGGITEQMVFKSYKGGTEQILPENGAVPVTAPFVGDIKYPDATRNDQEFLYRQSPAEEDGLAKITDIKGNTLVWNQLVQNGNFSAISPWSINSGGTLAVANNEASVTLTSVPSNVYTPNIRQATASGFVINHKYLFSFEVYLPHRSYMRVEFGGGGFGQDTDGQLSENTWHRVLMVRARDTAPTSNYLILYPPYATGVWSANDVWKIRNVNVFDLTQMGLDITSADEFTLLFSEPYYDYCQGAMLSFGGRNVKFNQLLQNGNITSASGWTPTRGTVSASGNVLSYTYSEVAIGAVGNRVQINVGTVSGHSYLLSVDAKLSKTKTILVLFTSNGTYNVQGTYSANTWKNVHTIVKESSNSTYVGIGFNADSNNVNGDVEQIRNFQVFDLTEMFGAGNEPSAEGFLELFPNDYYEYNVGQYMNLGQPVSLKTTGKNLLPYPYLFETVTRTGITMTVNTDGSIKAIGTNTSSVVQRYDLANITLEKGSYIFTGFAPQNGAYGTLRDGDSDSWIMNIGVNNPLTVSKRTNYRITLNIVGNASIDTTYYPLIRFADADSSYEPYTESTLSIPLDEFPNGMDGINDVHDEKNETEYVKRFATIKVNTVASGSLRNNGDYYAAVNGVTNAKPADNGTVANMICNICETMSAGARYTSTKDAVCARTTGSIELCISGITSRADLQAYVDSHDIYITYELATPLENYGVVDLGTLNWTYSSDVGHLRFYTEAINDSKKPSSGTILANVICNKYQTVTESQVFGNINIGICLTSTGRAMVYDPSYSSAEAFKQAMQGVYLLYEKENSEGFTTATLVTENSEVALANENGVLVGKCNSDVSADAGFIEGKIKLSDENGDVYSNKIQIHVERKPS